MTGTRMRAVVVVGLVASVGAFAADVDRHRQFMTDGIYDPALPNAEAYRIVREGIESDDSEAAYVTVAALTPVAMVERLAEHGIDDWCLAKARIGVDDQNGWPTRIYPGLSTGRSSEAVVRERDARPANEDAGRRNPCLDVDGLQERDDARFFCLCGLPGVPSPKR